jgi:hypothetical protein
LVCDFGQLAFKAYKLKGQSFVSLRLLSQLKFDRFKLGFQSEMGLKLVFKIVKLLLQFLVFTTDQLPIVSCTHEYLNRRDSFSKMLTLLI